MTAKKKVIEKVEVKEELPKPCPWNCAKGFLRVRLDRHLGYYIVCDHCGTHGPYSKKSEADAWEKWNVRI